MNRIAIPPLRLLAGALGLYVGGCAIYLFKPRILRSLAHGTVAWQDVMPSLGSDLLLIAMALVGVVIFARSAVGSDPTDAARRLANRWGLIIVLAIWLPVTILYSTGVIDGERFFWTRDDQIISLIYAKNLVAGKGLTWAGVRLEGYSNPLWVAWMALIFALGVSTKIAPLVLLISNVLVGAALIWISTASVKRLNGGPMAMFGTALAVALTPFGLGLARGGWEAIPVAALTGLAFCRIVDEHRSGQPRLATGLLLGVIALVRIDGMIVSAVLGLWMWLGSQHRGRALVYGLIGTLLPIAMFVFRYEYFGDWLPNTVYLKTTNWPDKTRVGVRYVGQFLAQMAPVMALAAYCAYRRKGFAESLVLGLAVILVAQVADAGGDYYPNFRMLMPVVPLLFALGFVGIEQVTTGMRWQLVLAAISMVGIAIIFPDILGRYASIETRELDDIRVAQTLQQVCGDQRVADVDAGVPYYFSDCKGIDLLGKIDAVIAHGPAVPGDNTVAHNKYDMDYSLGVLRPGFVIGAVEGDVPDAEEMQRLRDMGTLIPEHFYTNRYFLEYCLPHPVPSSANRRIYRCDWSTLPALPASG